MTIAAPLETPDVPRRVIRLQVLTIAWMTVEAVGALGAAWTARSPALLGVGGDNAIELFSAVIAFGDSVPNPILRRPRGWLLV
jgi:hypothetical protein